VTEWYIVARKCKPFTFRLLSGTKTITFLANAFRNPRHFPRARFWFVPVPTFPTEGGCGTTAAYKDPHLLTAADVGHRQSILLPQTWATRPSAYLRCGPSAKDLPVSVMRKHSNGKIKIKNPALTKRGLGRGTLMFLCVADILPGHPSYEKPRVGTTPTLGHPPLDHLQAPSSPTQRRLALLYFMRKSSPSTRTTRHISCRRERMRSPMRSPSVSSRAARAGRPSGSAPAGGRSL
jgi:hypothetical protein